MPVHTIGGAVMAVGVLVGALLALTIHPLQATTFTVTNTNDGGPGSGFTATATATATSTPTETPARTPNVSPSATTSPTPSLSAAASRTPTASGTATPTATRTPSPTLAALGGRGFTLQDGTHPSFTWDPGELTRGYLLVRWSPQSGFALLPRFDQPVLGVSYSDTDALPDEAYCYAVLVLRGNPPIISQVLGLSDLLCVYPRSGEGNAPRQFRVRLNEGQAAILEWQAPLAQTLGTPTGYWLTITRFDGSTPQTINLEAGRTSYPDATGWQSSCYQLEAMGGGRTDRLCAVPGVAFIPTGAAESQSTSDLLERLRAARRGR